MVWPEITKLYAKRAIKFKDININQYNETAENIRQSIKKIGSEELAFK